MKIDNKEFKACYIMKKTEDLENILKSIHTMKTRHQQFRYKRTDVVFDMCKYARLVASFYVDKGHENGAEIHHVLSNGCILIFNAKTGLYITSLIARPHQITRLFRWSNEKVPFYLIDKSKDNQKKGMNHDSTLLNLNKKIG